MNNFPTSSKATILLFFTLLLASCAGRSNLPNHAFEGTITQTIHMQGLMNHIVNAIDSTKQDSGKVEGSEKSSGGLGDLIAAAAGNAQIKLYVREDKVAYELNALGGFIKVRSIINRNDRTMTMLLPSKQALVFHLKSLDSTMKVAGDTIRQHPGTLDSLQASLPQATGKHMVINGYEADEYRAKSKGMDVDLWLTDDPRMKFYEVVRDAILGRNKTGESGVEEVFALLAPISGGKVPVKTVFSSNGEVLMTSELSEMKEEKLSDDLFTIPKGYTITNADSMKSAQKPPTPRRSPTGAIIDSTQY